jgi:hypothetical protein
MFSRWSVWIALAALAVAVPASAGGLAGDTPGFAPRVPVSSLALPGFDMSRLHITTSVSVGSGFGRGTNALQVTSLSYQFGAPLWMNVSLGNAWGQSNPNGRSSFFLEGFQVAYRPIPSMLIQVQYRDIRSPLQYSDYNYPGYGFSAP